MSEARPWIFMGLLAPGRLRRYCVGMVARSRFGRISVSFWIGMSSGFSFMAAEKVGMDVPSRGGRL